MNLHEYQAKRLLAEEGVPVPRAIPAFSVREAVNQARELGGSAWEAALTSFLLFAIGAIVPLFAFIFWKGLSAVFISIGMSMVGLFILGSVVTLFTGQGVLKSGLRMVIFGAMAAAVTFGIGKLIGVTVSG